MTSDELKGLRTRRSVLIAELTRIEEILITEGAFEDKKVRPLSTREQFYRDAENDFRNAGANGNYE